MTLRLTITRINYSKGGIILISSITKSPLMVITLNTRRVKAVHRLDSNPNKPANSREIYRLAVDRPLIHVVLVPNLLVFTTFYARQRHRRIGEEEEERKGFVTYIRTNICQISRPPGGCYLGDIYEITRVHDRGDGLVP